MAQNDDETRPTLPDEAREHLGRKLRASLAEDDETPAYLGDPVTPLVFQAQVRRLQSRLDAHEKGKEAVEAALRDVLGE